MKFPSLNTFYHKYINCASFECWKSNTGLYNCFVKIRSRWDIKNIKIRRLIALYIDFGLAFGLIFIKESPKKAKKWINEQNKKGMKSLIK